MALGRSSLPTRVAFGRREYRLETVFKHDFFAATALYRAEKNGPDTEPNGADAQPSDAHAEPKDADAKPSGPHTEPKDADAQPSGARTEPDGPDAEPGGADTKPEGVDTVTKDAADAWPKCDADTRPEDAADARPEDATKAAVTGAAALPARIVLKVGRRASLFGVPLGWIGRWHAAHESACYQALADVAAVPAFVGRYGRHGFAHAYVEGHPLHKGEQVADDFFPRLRAALAAIHARDMAYVDLEKCENVLVSDDGRPYLIDFQIAWRWPGRYGGNLWPARWLRRRMQRADFYHVTKLQRRTRPDQLTADELAASYAKPWYVRLHGRLTRPFTLLRRRLLNRIDPEMKRGERGRVHPPEGRPNG